MKSVFILSIGLILISCGSKNNNSITQKRLPYLGEPAIVSSEVNGKLEIDSIFPTIPKFSFINQNGDTITKEDFNNKIYIADFFFTTCPTICPKMKSELLRVYEKFQTNNEVSILSHTIDPDHDSVKVLKDYAERLKVIAPSWHFVTGNRDSIYTIAESYLASAEEDASAPGGFVHSGALILIDKNKFIRGIYDGTKSEEVDKLISDIPILLNEK